MDADNVLKLADAAGIETHYWDNHGNRHDASHETIRSLLAAFGIAAETDAEVWASLTHFWRTPWMQLLAPVLTLKEDEPVAIPLRAWEEQSGRILQWELVLEDGDKRSGSCRLGDLKSDDIAYFDNRRVFQYRLPLEALPLGYHTFRVDGEEAATRLIVAPRRCHMPEGMTRAWGLMVQLYALKSRKDWGIGDFSALEALVDQVADAGGAAIGLNPLHALFLNTPENASPYSPCSRLFRNPLYLDVPALPDFAECPDAQAIAAMPEFAQVLQSAHDNTLVPYRAVTSLKLPVLERCYSHFVAAHLAKNTARAGAFRSFVVEHGREMEDFATFQALAEHYRALDWSHWAPHHQDAKSDAVTAFRATRADRIGFYQYLQWCTDQQFSHAAQRANAKGMAVGLYNDLAVSVDASSADYWMHRQQFAGLARVGAPPDPFNEMGQDWGLVPLNPMRLKETGYSYYRALLAANMRHAGALRIDHVMGLTRLYLIPQGMKPTEGAYVRFPLNDLLAVATLESRRNQCMVIGEDLGTVPAGFREKLSDASIFSSRVLYFERNRAAFRSPEVYPRLAAVSVSTHDLATLSGFWQGEDLKAKAQIGLFKSADEETAAMAGRTEDKRELLKALAAEELLPKGISPADADHLAWTAALTAAVHAYLARSPSQLMMVQLDDLVGQTHQANLPGSVTEYPNWRRRLTIALEDLGADPAFRKALAGIGAARL
jgi:(1->4)-alpha-D-glucan 1-alpha-D-glucosylmutase